MSFERGLHPTSKLLEDPRRVPHAPVQVNGLLQLLPIDLRSQLGGGENSARRDQHLCYRRISNLKKTENV